MSYSSPFFFHGDVSAEIGLLSVFFFKRFSPFRPPPPGNLPAHPYGKSPHPPSNILVGVVWRNRKTFPCPSPFLMAQGRPSPYFFLSHFWSLPFLHFPFIGHLFFEEGSLFEARTCASLSPGVRTPVVPKLLFG